MDIEDILKIDDTHRETVRIPQWNADILVVSMTALERSDIEKKWAGAGRSAASDPGSFRADILSKSLKKSDGTPFGTDEQIRKLMGKNAHAIEKLFEAACRVSAFTNSDVEVLEKN